MTAIKIQDLTKAYGDVTAVDGLPLTVAEGELFGLLGPNGAGKITTMEVLTGQITPERGSVAVLDVDPVADPTAVRERVGILPEKESPPSFIEIARWIPRPLRSGRKPTLDEICHARWQGRLPPLE